MAVSRKHHGPVRKDERLEVRVSAAQKELVQRAASLQGRTLSEFVASSLQQAAEQTIREHEVVSLTAQESIAFVEALLASPAPNEHLLRLAERYRRTTSTEE
jgi:uncharacterized protein (DUF1778 family)